ncbi:MAG TPA: DinB family protein [Bryobacteraceae bacterium]|nr:DinB family protein [Bryobacteraceae bacterium]
MTFNQMLLPEFEEEMKNTRKLLERIPDGKFDYKPHPKSMTLGQLATHVAQIPGWAASTMDVELLEFGPDFKPEVANTRGELLAMFDKGVVDARQKISAATDADFQKIWTLKFDGKTMFSMPRTAVMRSLIMNHLIHHRAQLGVYLRLNDVAIPGMYGPSADDAASTNAAQA